VRSNQSVHRRRSPAVVGTIPLAGPAGRVTDVSDLGGERFALTATPPVRALAIASLVAVVGAALAVGSRALGLGRVALVAGVAGLVLGVVLALAAAILVVRLRSTLLLDSDGITVIRGRRTDQLPWSDITSVNLAGPRLTLVTKAASGIGVSVLNPRSSTDPKFLALLAAIRGRLDADRGYPTC
jgi:hypothetical protein